MGDTYFERLFTWYTQMHLVKWCVLNYCKVYVVLKTILARLFAVRYLYLLLTRRKTDFTSAVCRLLLTSFCLKNYGLVQFSTQRH